jgi:predicted lipoprotein
MRRLRSSSLATACFILLSTTEAVAEVTLEQWRDYNLNIVDKHIQPGYQQLAQQSNALHKSLTALCQQPDSQRLQQAQAQFQRTTVAWQAIQHINFGPIDFLMRRYSIHYWPDKKNLTSKQLNRILDEKSPTALKDESLRDASIAIKGLPALERILFAEKALPLMISQPYRCRYAEAVSRYVAQQSAGTAQEWLDYRMEYAATSSDDGIYESAEDAAIDMLKAQIEPIEVIHNRKLLYPLGKAKAKARRLENWRSGGSVANLSSNITALHQMYSGIEGTNLSTLLQQQGHEAIAVRIEKQFKQVEQQIASLPQPLSRHITKPSVRKQVMVLIAEMETLDNAFSAAVQALNLELGFNSQDGD